jgi:hypothetical protein
VADFDARVQVVVEAKKALDTIKQIENRVRQLTEDTKKIDIAVQERRSAQRDVNRQRSALRNALALDAATALYQRRLTQIGRLRGDLNQDQQKTLQLAKDTASAAKEDLDLMQAAATALGRLIEQRNELNRAEKKSFDLQRRSGAFTERIDKLSRTAGNDVQGLQAIRDRNKELSKLAKARKDEAIDVAEEIERELRAKEDAFKRLQDSRKRASQQAIEQQKLENRVLKDAKRIYAQKLDEVNKDRIKRLNTRTSFAGLEEQAENIRRGFAEAAFKDFADKTKTQKVWREFFDASEVERSRFRAIREKEDKEVAKNYADAVADAEKRRKEKLDQQATLDKRKLQGTQFEGDRIAAEIDLARRAMKLLGQDIDATAAKTEKLEEGVKKTRQAATGSGTAAPTRKARTPGASLLPEFDAKSAQLQREYKKSVQEIGQENVKLLDLSRERLDKQSKSVKLARIEERIFASGAALRAGEIQQAKQLNAEAEQLLNTERQRSKLAEKRLNKRRDNNKKALGNALVSGAFPALFGGGLGQSLGGLIGGAIGSKAGLGELFGIVGSAIGGAIESAVRFAERLSTELLTATSAMEALNAAGIQYSATQEKIARDAKKVGDFVGAQNVVDNALQEQIGVDQQTLQGIASPVKLLDNAWKRLTATAGAALGTVFAPFVALLAGALEIVSAVFRAFNQIIGAVRALLNLIPGFKFFIDQANEAVLKTTTEYQKQLSLLDQQTEALKKKARAEAEIQKLQTDSLRIDDRSEQALRDLGELRGGRAAAVGVTDRVQAQRIKDLQEQKKLEQEIQRIRLENPSTTDEQRLKINEQILAQVEQSGAQSLTAAQDRANTLISQARVAAFNLEDDINRKRERGQERLLRRQQSIRESIENKILNLRRQQEDIYTNTARLIEDVQVKGVRFALDTAQKISELRRRDAELAINTAKTVARIRGAFLGEEARNRQEFQVGLQAAVNTYKNERKQIEEDARIQILQTRLDEFEAILKIERFREDQAKKIARINEDSVRYVAKIRRDLEEYTRQTAKAVKDAQLVRIRAVEAELELLRANAKANAAYFTQQSIAPGVDAASAQILSGQAQAELRKAEVYKKALDEIITDLVRQAEKIKIEFPKLEIPDLPSLQDDTSRATEAQTALESYMSQVRQRITLLTQEISLGESQNKLLKESTDLYFNQISQYQSLSTATQQRIQQQMQLNELVRQGLTLSQAEAEVERQKAERAALQTIEDSSIILNDPSIPEAVKEEFRNLNAELLESIESFEKLRKFEQSFGFKLQKRITEVTSEFNEMTDAANAVSRVAADVSNTIGAGFADVATAGFDDLFSSMFGLEKQTKSVQEAFADMFKAIGQQFLNFAQDLVAKALEKFILNAVADIFGASLEGIVENGPLLASNSALTSAVVANTIAVKANTVALAVPKLAKGGVATGGMPHIVGEVGPELFIPRETGTVVPNNKLMQALEDMAEPRMSGGAVAANQPYKVGESGPELFVPDDGLSPYDVARSSMVTAGKTVTTKEQAKKEEQVYEELRTDSAQDINVRYESTVINEQTYVTEEQFQAGLKVGIKQARSQTLKQFRNRPAVRGKAGI